MDSIFPLREVNLNVDMTSNISLSVSNKDLHLNYLRGDSCLEVMCWGSFDFHRKRGGRTQGMGDNTHEINPCQPGEKRV